jgi:hypothetical protein
VVALDEIYGNNRHGAYLSVVDAHSGAVWVTVGPVAVDGETWTLVLWEGQAQGLRWCGTVSDGGGAMAQATATVDPQGRHQRYVWHVLHECSKVQGRLKRQVTTLQEQAATVARLAARVAAGQRPLGRHPRTDVAAHAAVVAQAQQAADNLRYLTATLHDLLEVVVLGRDGVLDSAAREDDLRALLALLADLAASAPAACRADLHRLQPPRGGGALASGALLHRPAGPPSRRGRCPRPDDPRALQAAQGLSEARPHQAGHPAEPPRHRHRELVPSGLRRSHAQCGGPARQSILPAPILSGGGPALGDLRAAPQRDRPAQRRLCAPGVGPRDALRAGLLSQRANGRQLPQCQSHVCYP